jgi:hypothetical protein
MAAPRSALWLVISAALALLGSPAVRAQPTQQGSGSVSLTVGTFTTPYTQDFDTLANSGTTGTALPTGWYYIESGSNADNTYGISTGSMNAGNTYSFGSSGSTDRAFGTLLSNTVTSTIGASFTNNTGSVIAELQVAYFGEQWRHGQADGNIDRLDFQYSTNATSLTTGTWTDFDALDFLTPNITDSGALDGNAAGNRTFRSSTITGLNIPDGGTFWIRWLDFNVGGADDGLAVDDFSIRPVPVPEPGAVIAVAAVGMGLVRRRTRRATA